MTSERFWVAPKPAAGDTPAWREVDRAEFIATEHRNGFHPKVRGSVATAAFGGERDLGTTFIQTVRRHLTVPGALCGVRDGDHGTCGLSYDHPGVIHTEYRDDTLWAEWRSVLWEDELTGSTARTAFVQAGLHR